jgi:hypothetical protein
VNLLRSTARLVNRIVAPFGVKVCRSSTPREVDACQRIETVARSIEDQLQAIHKEVLLAQVRMKWFLVDRVEQREGRRPLQCPVCGTLTTDYAKPIMAHCRFGGGTLLRYECTKCGGIFGPEKMLRLTPQELAEEYELHYRIFSEGDTTSLEKQAFAALNPRRDGVYLNYGSGAWSRALPELRAEGWNVLGYDPHVASAADYIIRDESVLRSMRFDGLISNNLIEHLADPVAAFCEMKSLLKDDNSVMAHATPCYTYSYEYTRFHLFFYTGRSVEWLCREAGLEIRSQADEGDYRCRVFVPRRLGS